MECSKYCAPQAQFFGELHNEALDYVYEQLKAFQGQAVSGALGLKVQSTVAIALNDFFKKNLPLLSEITSTAAQNTLEKIYSLNGDWSAFQEYVFGHTFFSPTGVEFLNRLREALASGQSPDEFQRTLAGIYNDAFNKLEGRESEQMLSILQIGIYSSQYWADASNREKWGALTNNLGAGAVGRIDWGTVGKADVAGAVGGAVRFGVVAVFGGPVGWGAFAGGTLGGAAAGSVGAAVLGWMD